MTTEPHNPFVLPGFGQTGEMAGNPVMASMEMMRKAWQGLAGHGSFGTPSMAASMSVEDLERRISDLRAVENWLRMNLTVLSNTIQGLEVQRATISTLKTFVTTASASIPSGQEGASALETLLGIRPAARTQAAATPAPAAAPAADAGKAQQATDAGAATEPADASAALGAMFDSDKAVAATQAWWGLLQKQFDSLAAATAATMQPAADPAGQDAAAAQGGRSKASAPGKAKARAAAPSTAAKPARKPRAAKSAARPTTRSGGR